MLERFLKIFNWIIIIITLLEFDLGGFLGLALGILKLSAVINLQIMVRVNVHPHSSAQGKGSGGQNNECGLGIWRLCGAFAV